MARDTAARKAAAAKRLRELAGIAVVDTEEDGEIARASVAPAPTSKKSIKRDGKMFTCSGYGECKSGFTRAEHLARHIRKHTGERPFKCHCGKTSSRVDNLRRHTQIVHSEMAEANNATMKQVRSEHNKLKKSYTSPQKNSKGSTSDDEEFNFPMVESESAPVETGYSIYYLQEYRPFHSGEDVDVQGAALPTTLPHTPVPVPSASMDPLHSAQADIEMPRAQRLSGKLSLDSTSDNNDDALSEKAELQEAYDSAHEHIRALSDIIDFLLREKCNVPEGFWYDINGSSLYGRVARDPTAGKDMIENYLTWGSLEFASNYE